MKSLIKTLTYIALSSTLAFSAYAEQAHVVKKIEIKAKQGEDVKIYVGENDNNTTLFISQDELNDPALLEEKLSELDPESRASVEKALSHVKVNLSGTGSVHHGNKVWVHASDTDGEHAEKVIIMKKGDGEVVDLDEDVEVLVDSAYHGGVMKKHIEIIDGSNATIKGHTDVIERLINKGEFTKDELDRLQQALDAKR